jgi:micrococcal nuclease
VALATSSINVIERATAREVGTTMVIRRRTRRQRPANTSLVGLALGTLALVGCGTSGGADANDEPGAATVVSVVDGDTLEVELGDSTESVRLIGVDTPESVARDRPNECYGQEASEHLAALTPSGSQVRLERDLEARDRYGRLLAYVYRAGDGLFVNHDLVAGGYAEAMPYPPNTARESDFDAAQTAAQQGGAGLWSACGSADVPLDTPR